MYEITRDFSAEIRAYTFELEWLRTNTRPEEFLVETSEDQHDYREIILPVEATKFTSQRHKEIRYKIEWYYDRFIDAFKDPLLSVENRNHILEAIELLLEPNSPVTIEMIKHDLKQGKASPLDSYFFLKSTG